MKVEQRKKSKVIRKRIPSGRRDIMVATLEKIRQFMKNQSEPVYKAEISREAKVDFNSLNIALEMLPIKYHEDGKISLKKKQGGKKDV